MFGRKKTTTWRYRVRMSYPTPNTGGKSKYKDFIPYVIATKNKGKIFRLDLDKNKRSIAFVFNDEAQAKKTINKIRRDYGKRYSFQAIDKIP